MARWLPALTLLVLLAHGLVLWGIGQEISALGSVLDERTDPLFTRSISEQGTDALAPGKPSDSAAPEAIRESLARTIVPTPAPAATQTIPRLTPSTQTTAPVAKAAPIDTATDTPQPSTPIAVNAKSALTEQSATTTVASPVRPPPESIHEPDKGMPTPAPTPAPGIAAAQATTTTSPSTTGSALISAGIWPGDTRVSYHLGGHFRGPLHGSGSVQWTRQSGSSGESYQVRVVMDFGLGKITMTSQGLVTDAGLVSHAFEEVRPNGKRRTVSIDDTGITLDKGQRLPRPPGAPLHAVQDSVSQFIDLGHRFMTGKQVLQAGAVARVWLARPGGMDEWIFDAQAPEMLQLPGFSQAVQAFRFVPRPIANRRGHESAEYWIAPSLQYLPVKVRITNGGEAEIILTLTQVLQR